MTENLPKKRPWLPTIVALGYVGLIYSTLSVIRPAVTALREANLLRITLAVIFLLAVGVIWRVYSKRFGFGFSQIAARFSVMGLALGGIILAAHNPEECIHRLQY